MKTRYLIIGNSAGGIGAAEAIRQCDAKGTIAIVSEEPYPAYSRPLISKYLAGECTQDKMLYRTPDFYDKNAITILTGKKVSSLDVVARTARLADGTQIDWQKLLLATGGVPIVPKMEGQDTRGVFTFTTLDDAKAVGKFARKGMRAVVIGGGLIGVSVTEALVKLGVRVTVVEMKDRILNTMLDETASAIAAETLARHDVRIITGRTVAEINSEFTTERIHAVTLDDSRGIPCEMVILAIGVRPRTELAVASGIKVNRGIVVDRNMRTSHPDVSACGDTAEAYDFIYGENRVTPIWPNAYIGGRVAGFNMAGTPTEYAGGTAMNSLNYFGVAIASAGLAEPPDTSYEVTTRCSGQDYRKVILKEGRLAGIIFCGNIERSGIVYGLMKDGIDVSGFKQALVADDFSFVSLPEPLWRARLAGSFKKPRAVEEQLALGVRQ